MRIVVHISDRIDMHEGRHRVDHNQHDAGERIDTQRPVKGQRARIHPMENRDADSFGIMAKRYLEEDNPGQDCHENHQAGCDVFTRFGSDLIAEQAGNKKADKRKEDDRVVEHLPVNLS